MHGKTPYYGALKDYPGVRGNLPLINDKALLHNSKGAMSQVDFEPASVERSGDADRWMVVIFNNDHNSVEEVLDILIVATNCDLEEAEIETWEAHTFGNASVHFASQEKCEEVAEIIETIGVRTEVTKEWPE